MRSHPILTPVVIPHHHPGPGTQPKQTISTRVSPLLGNGGSWGGTHNFEGRAGTSIPPPF